MKELKNLDRIGLASDSMMQELPFSDIAAASQEEVDYWYRGVFDCPGEWCEVDVAAAVGVWAVVDEPGCHLDVVEGTTSREESQ